MKMARLFAGLLLPQGGAARFSVSPPAEESVLPRARLERPKRLSPGLMETRAATRPWSHLFLSLLLFACLVPRSARAASPNLLLSEVMLVNTKTIPDEDGEYSDWIEIFNPGSNHIDLLNWSLTDQRSNLTQWRFPSTNIGPGEFLLVFASGKNRRMPGAFLHTNFRLSSSGEYLGLIMPDGRSIAHEFAPQVPSTGADLSYGLGATGTNLSLVATGAHARAVVPIDGSLANRWTERGFDDSAWIRGTTGVGYERQSGYEDLIGLDLLSSSLPMGQRIDTNGDGVNENTTVYIRVPFQIENPGVFNNLALQLRYADGFVAYLNGQQVASANEPPLIDWKASAASDYGEITDVMMAIVYGPGNAITIYRNGEVYSAAATATTGTLRVYPANVGDILIGKRHDDLPNTGGTRDGTDGFLAGSVNEARVYAQPLGASEIQALFQRGPFGANGTLPPESRSNLLHQWTFNDGTARDSIGNSHGTLNGGAQIQDGRLVLDGIDDFMRSAPISTNISIRTLVVWVSLDNLSQRGGSALTIENPTATDVFDGIVFGERVVQQWMNGSSLYARSVRDNGGAPETLTESVVTGPETFDVSRHAGLLVSGTNVLAIHGLIYTHTDPDFLIRPELIGGHIQLDARNLGVFDRPTPGRVNAPRFQRVAANLVFSHERGFYQTPFSLRISTDIPDVEIRYTLDGREPNAVNGLPYIGPIEISRTRTVRVTAVRAGLAPSEPITHTYVFVADVLRQTNSAPPGSHWDTEMDPNVVNNFNQTWSVAEGLVDLPAVSIVMDNADLFGSNGIYANPTGRGDEWERAASLEFFYPPEYGGPRTGKGFSINCGIQINGNFSRLTHQPKHSFRLVFKDKWGPPKLRYPLFPNYDVTEFDTLLIACGHNQGWSTGIDNSQFLRNRFTWDLEGADPSRAKVHNRSVHVYLNGLYWGVYDFNERPDETFAAANFGGAKEEYDVFKGLSTGGSTSAPIINGLRSTWDQLFVLAGRNLELRTNYTAVAELADIDQLIDYSIGILYTADRDGPTGWLNGPPNSLEPKNFYSSRRRTPDGRFRFWRWDSEFVLENVNEDVSERQGTQNPGRLHFNLRANPDYRMRFADRVQEFFFNGGPFSVEALQDRYLALAEEIDKAVVSESARWGDSKREPPFRRDVEWMRERDRILTNYIPARQSLFLNQLRLDRLFPTNAAPVLQLNGVARHGSLIASNDLLSFAGSAGTIYFTLDGSDPRDPAQATAVALVSETSPARAVVPRDGALSSAWRERQFDDSSWASGRNGVGYERGAAYRELLGLDLLSSALPAAQRLDVDGDGTNENNSIFTRFRFTVPDPSGFNALTLNMRYDDGFVAYLNGVEVARASAPASVAWNSTATQDRGDGGEVMIAIAYGPGNSITIYRNGSV
ncbi:MAG: hypothetical protein FJ405_09060, partial [Verrucomicrobia bacterium]|nr:hypothetical protein [Verrucomicrobiota bacterium]